MTDLETRLTDHLQERAAAVDVHPDLAGVLAEASTPPISHRARSRRSVVAVAAAALVVVGLGSIAVVAVRDPGPSAPADEPFAATSLPAPSATVVATTTTVTTVSAASPTSGDSTAVLAIGDSVMLGAADELAAGGIAVSAEVSRQMRSMIPVVQRLRDTGQLGEAVVVQLGSNGSLDDETLSEFFSVLSDVPQVVVLTTHAPRDWVGANNARLVALPAEFPNVTVLDWDALSNQCPGDCFYDDGVHLRQDGQRYYSQLIFDRVGSANGP